MSSLLIKNKLDKDVIDLSIGEPEIIKTSTSEMFGDCFHSVKKTDIDYQHPSGLPDLVSLLEERFGGKIIVTNGAKQALSAVFYAIHKIGFRTMGMITPHWALLPPLSDIHSISPLFYKHEDHVSAISHCFLDVSPNNPDGKVFDYKNISSRINKDGVYIHDAAYYTPSYLGSEFKYDKRGSVQIYSFSKMFGLSGARVGFISCQNDELYQHLLHYVESTTVGVSSFSQRVIVNIFDQLKPDVEKEFHHRNFSQLRKNKELFKNVPDDVLEVPNDFEAVNGMFGWLRKGVNFDPGKVKINVSDGKYFGDQDFVRINLGLENKKIEEVVDRLQKRNF